MNRVRGFERISIDQFNIDFKKEIEEVNVSYDDIKLPKRGTAKSAGYDAIAPFDFILQPNWEIKVPTGIKAYMLNDEVLKAFPRSGHGFSFYLRLANTVAIIDSDYHNNPKNEGHIFIKLRNEGDKPLIIKKGEGLCQFIFEKYLLADGDTFDGNLREGGFGSTTKVK